MGRAAKDQAQMKVARLIRALAATLLYAVRLNRLGEKIDPVMDKVAKCQAIKTPNCRGAHTPNNGV